MATQKQIDKMKETIKQQRIELHQAKQRIEILNQIIDRPASMQEEFMEFAIAFKYESNNDHLLECWPDLDESWAALKEKMDAYIKEIYNEA